MLAAAQASPDSAKYHHERQPSQTNVKVSDTTQVNTDGGARREDDDDDETLWQGLPDWAAELQGTQLEEVLSGGSDINSSQAGALKRDVPEGMPAPGASIDPCTPSKRPRLAEVLPSEHRTNAQLSSPVADSVATQLSTWPFNTPSTIQATATPPQPAPTHSRAGSNASQLSTTSPSRQGAKPCVASPIEKSTPTRRTLTANAEDGVEQGTPPSCEEAAREKRLLKAVGWGSSSSSQPDTADAGGTTTPPPPASFEMFDPGNPWTQVPRGTQAARSAWLKQWDDDWRKEKRDADASSDVFAAEQAGNGRSREPSTEELVAVAHAKATQVLARASTSPTFSRREAIEVLYRAPETRSPGSARRPLLSEMDEERKKRYLRQFDRMEGVGRSDDEDGEGEAGWEPWPVRNVNAGAAAGPSMNTGRVGTGAAALVDSPARGQVTLASRGAAAQGGVVSPAAARRALRGGAPAGARTPKTWASTWGSGGQDGASEEASGGRSRGKAKGRGRGGGRGAKRGGGRSFTK